MRTAVKLVRTLMLGALFAWRAGGPLGSYDLGLSTRFSDIILENLKLGNSYNISQLKSLPLTIINGSTIETEVRVEVDQPKEGELKEGYEPIPDPAWVTVVPDQFRLVPGGRNLSDIIITIPDEQRFLGRHFQVMFWAHTLQEGFLGVGVRVRVRFSVEARSPESLQQEMKKKRMLNLNFRLEPNSISAANVPVGKKVSLYKEYKSRLKMVNTGTTDLNMRFAPKKYLNPQVPPSGYEELPDLSWVEVSPQTLVSEPDTILPLDVFIHVPDKPEHRGKKYAILMDATLEGGEIPLNVYSQILIETEK